jgi:hypothetical protein
MGLAKIALPLLLLCVSCDKGVNKNSANNTSIQQPKKIAPRLELNETSLEEIAGNITNAVKQRDSKTMEFYFRYHEARKYPAMGLDWFLVSIEDTAFFNHLDATVDNIWAEKENAEIDLTYTTYVDSLKPDKHFICTKYPINLFLKKEGNKWKIYESK